MRRPIILAALVAPAALVVPAVLAAAEAGAAPARCGARETVVAHLERRWGETQRALGIAGDRQLLEVFASDAGTWTILLTSARGRTCMMAAGSDFRTVAPEPAQGDPA